MKIGLVAAKMRDNDIKHQMEQIETYIGADPDMDLVCFGESFLQGFDGLTWNYEEDLTRAISLQDPVISNLRALAKNHACGISLGFIERDGESLYSSNLVLDKRGEIADLFRRVSTGWKESIATEMYKEGDGFHAFTFLDKTLAVAICGDLWNDHNLNLLKAYKLDGLLWPLYIDFSVERWFHAEFSDYAARSKELGIPIFFINSMVDDPERANGGCYVFQNGEAIASLPLGESGMLSFDF